MHFVGIFVPDQNMSETHNSLISSVYIYIYISHSLPSVVLSCRILVLPHHLLVVLRSSQWRMASVLLAYDVPSLDNRLPPFLGGEGGEEECSALNFKGLRVLEDV